MGHFEPRSAPGPGRGPGEDGPGGRAARGRTGRPAASAAALGYADPRVLLELRTALAGYLARARGVAVTPDRVLVCAGFAQGLELVCEALRARGAATLAVEALGHQLHRRIAEKN